MSTKIAFRKAAMPRWRTSQPLLALLVLALCCTSGVAWAEQSLNRTGTQWAPFIEWKLKNQSYDGNPFDVLADVTFTHSSSGATHKTGMFFDGDDTWKFRFTATKTGEWTFLTNSDDLELNGRSGTVVITANSDPDSHGFIQSVGNKWLWQGTDEAFIPQYVMGRQLGGFFDVSEDRVRDKAIADYVNTFVVEHGFSGFHFAIAGQWFDVGNAYEGRENPDPRTYEVLETLIQQVHDRGGACHLWMWLSDDRDTGPRGILGDPFNEADRRNLRYLAARLGALPGWGIGYGYDTENLRWATPRHLDEWKRFLETHLGWNHFIGARVGFDESGPRGGPKPALDSKRNAPIGDEYCSWLGGDYVGYTSYRPLYDRYVQALEHHPDRPSFEEDRFRLRDSDRWRHKDYSPELTRRGLWHSAMAGGVANIWGNELPSNDHDGSQPYDLGDVQIKHQIKTYATFFRDKHRFRSDFVRDNSLIEGGRVPNAVEEDDGELAACLRDPARKHFVFYSEGCSSITIDLTAMPDTLSAVAVDTRKAYKEINVGRLSPRRHTWQAPHESDWAIAVGDASAKLSASGFSHHHLKSNVNLISNGDFEQNEIGWNSWGGEERVVSGEGIDGSNACFIPGHNEHKPRRVVDRLGVPVVGGREYVFTVNMKTAGDGGRVRANIYWLNSAGQTIGNTQVICENKSTSDWKEYVKTWKAPGNAVQFNMHLRVFDQADNTAKGRSAWFDNISVVAAK